MSGAPFETALRASSERGLGKPMPTLDPALTPRFKRGMTSLMASLRSYYAPSS